MISAAMGVRQTFGLFLGPFAFDRGLPVTLIAFAIALHNLVWGFAQPFAGAAADRHGAAPVVAVGAIVFATGLVLAALAPAGPLLVLGLGVLVGIGVSCTSFGVVLAAVGRAAPPDKRSMALGLASAGGTYYLINHVFGGLSLPIAFFGVFYIPLAAIWWGAAVGVGTALAGSLLPAWTARRVRVADVFARVT